VSVWMWHAGACMAEIMLLLLSLPLSLSLCVCVGGGGACVRVCVCVCVCYVLCVLNTRQRKLHHVCVLMCRRCASTQPSATGVGCAVSHRR
jgi:hypothetical protein